MRTGLGSLCRDSEGEEDDDGDGDSRRANFLFLETETGFLGFAIISNRSSSDIEGVVEIYRITHLIPNSA